MDKERIAWLKKHVEKADYCHLGTWGHVDDNSEDDFTYDVQTDILDLIKELEDRHVAR